MYLRKKILCLALAAAMLVPLLAGCSGGSEEPAEETTAEDGEYSYSDGIDENGFWQGIKALDYVEMFDYRAIPVPNDSHQVTDEAIQNEIDYIMTQFPVVEHVMDRPARDGDTLNIDYVGSVDGVEFENGSTGGLGTEVTIGVTTYIDDFLQQLIGHRPGEVVNVEVTFPVPYQEPTLEGKDALFITTINYIVEEGEADLTDAFVRENLFAYFGWTSVEEMRGEIYSTLVSSGIKQYIREYFTGVVTVRSVPDKLVEYQEKSLLKYYEDYAQYYYGLLLEEFIIDYNGFASVDEFLEIMHDEVLSNATYYLVIQAVAEDAGFSVSEDDLAGFFAEQNGSEDYSSYEEQFGMPYLKQLVLSDMVIEYVAQNAVLLGA